MSRELADTYACLYEGDSGVYFLIGGFLDHESATSYTDDGRGPSGALRIMGDQGTYEVADDAEIAYAVLRIQDGHMELFGAYPTEEEAGRAGGIVLPMGLIEPEGAEELAREAKIDMEARRSFEEQPHVKEYSSRVERGEGELFVAVRHNSSIVRRLDGYYHVVSDLAEGWFVVDLPAEYEPFSLNTSDALKTGIEEALNHVI